MIRVHIRMATISNNFCGHLRKDFPAIKLYDTQKAIHQSKMDRAGLAGTPVCYVVTGKNCQEPWSTTIYEQPTFFSSRPSMKKAVGGRGSGGQTTAVNRGTMVAGRPEIW